MAIDVLSSCVVVVLLTGETGIKSLSRGRKTLDIMQGDVVPQSLYTQFYRAGPFPFDRMSRFYNSNSINQAIADSKHGDTIKPVLRMGTFA